MQIKDLDLLLVEELRYDARQPVRALARKLGLKRSTIRYRLDRLLSEGILKIVCKRNTKLLGYKFSTLVGMRTRADRTMAVADHLATLPAFKHIVLTAGRFNIMAWAVYVEKSDLAHFISKDLTDIPDISSIEIMHTIQRIKALSHNKEATFSGDRLFQLSDLDLSLISVLEHEPRQTITNIAKKIGCSQAIARNSLNKLINDRVIRFFPIIDPTMFGTVNWSLILIKPELDKVNTVTDSLSSLKRVLDISLISGQWQISVVAGLREGKHMYDSISDVFSSVTGIKEFEVVHLLKTVKFSPTFL